ncbi:MAG: response regulator transcription factor [Oligoflexia bacterium]|nr:response regulator transcription factor [Oligoflexia bacterium]
MRILVVEDQRKMAGFLKKGLQEAGYRVDLAQSGAAASSFVADNDYDLIVLDVNLPDSSGFDLARQFKSEGLTCPILLLTALNTTKHKVMGLDSGGDDYLTKPFEFEELLARIRALLRRQTPQGQSTLRYKGLELDLLRREAKRDGVSIILTSKEFSLLEYFLRNPERPLSRTQILEHVWDTHVDNESNVVDVYINMLRKKIDAPFEKKLVHTQVGFGYVLKDLTCSKP